MYPFFVMQALCFALLACAFNLLIGYGGLLSFGHAMFLGTGGYVTAHALKVGAMRCHTGRACGSRFHFRRLAELAIWAARRSPSRPHHRIRLDPPPGHLLRDDHAGAVAIVVFHLSADPVHPWRGRHPGHPARLSVRLPQLVESDDPVLRHAGRVPVRLPGDLPHHQLAVRRGAESDPRERAACDLARLQDRSVQAPCVHPVGHAGGSCRMR